MTVRHAYRRVVLEVDQEMADTHATASHLLSEALGDDVLLVSCHGERGRGGLMSVGARGCRRLDDISTTGLALTSGGLLLRLVKYVDVTDPGGLLVYDRAGLRSYARLDEVRQAHDVLEAPDGTIAVASTGTNTIAFFDVDGAPVRSWDPGVTTGDCWHLNTLRMVGGALHATAFCTSSDVHGWERAVPGSGRVFDVASGATVIAGLDKPHHARFDGTSWFVCNSGAGEVRKYAADGVRLERVASLDGYTRGMALVGDVVAVGVSVHRGAANGAALSTAVLTLLDRSTLAPLASVELPHDEVYDVVRAPAPLADAVAAQSAAHRALRRPRAGGEPAPRVVATPLASSDRLASIEADVPSRMDVAGACEVLVRLTNRGTQPWSSEPPNPVHVGARWSTLGGEVLEDPQPRAVLSGVLPRGGSAVLALCVRTPAVPGTYCLEVTPVQEHVAWFSDDDLDSRASYVVEVAGRAEGRIGGSVP